MKNAQDLPVSFVIDGADRKSVSRQLAANAGSTQILRIPVSKGEVVYAEALVNAYAGQEIGQVPVSAINTGTDVLTSTAHGLITGQPVVGSFTAGGSQPAGIVATTIYFVRAVDANTFTLHPTAADAVGNANILNITSAGANVIVIPTKLYAVYKLSGVVANRNGVVALVGSAQAVAYENVAAWDVAIAADDTNDGLAINATPDTLLPTTFEVIVDFVRTA